MGRKKEHDEATKRALLDAAEKLVDEGGPDSVTVRSVAAAAVTTTRAVYSVFGSKDALLAELASRSYEVLAARVDRLEPTGDPIEDVIVVGTVAFRGFAEEHPSLFRLTYHRIVPGLPLGPEFYTTAQTTFGRLVQRVERAAEAGRLGSTDPRLVAATFAAMCEGLVSTALRGGRNFPAAPAEKIWDEALRSLLAGYGRTTVQRPLKPREES